MKHKTAGRSWDEIRSRPEGHAVARRNRAALEKARGTGASTYVREGFQRGDDGEVRLTKTQAQVPTPTDQERRGHHDDRPRTGRAPRRATNVRRRGSRRSPSRRSSERSGDSGDDGPSDEPPSRRRLCGLCGRDIPAGRSRRARYCSDRHAALARQRRKRQRDRARDGTPRIPTSQGRMLVLGEVELERLLQFTVCRCNRHRILDRDPVLGHRCVKCGRQRPESSLAQRVAVA